MRAGLGPGVAIATTSVTMALMVATGGGKLTARWGAARRARRTSGRARLADGADRGDAPVDAVGGREGARPAW